MSPSGFAAVVLAAGEGTRLKSARPKVLHEIAAQAMLANGDQRAVLLIPCGEGTEGCQDPAEARINATQIHPAPLTTGQGRLMPNDIVPAWRARLVRRYHLPGLGIPKD